MVLNCNRFLLKCTYLQRRSYTPKLPITKAMKLNDKNYLLYELHKYIYQVKGKLVKFLEIIFWYLIFRTLKTNGKRKCNFTFYEVVCFAGKPP